MHINEVKTRLRHRHNRAEEDAYDARLALSMITRLEEELQAALERSEQCEDCEVGPKE